MAKTSAKIQISFSTWRSKFEASYDKFVADLEGKIKTMRIQGMSDEAIMGFLDRTLKDEVGVFGPFVGDIEKQADDFTSIVAQTASNSEFDAEEKLVWVLDPSAKEHCDDCIANEKIDAQTFTEWETIGIPGAGNTECGEYCRCTLELAE